MTDHIENYLRIKTESDRNLALSLEHAFSGVADVARDTVTMIEEGGKRLLWRTSYFFEGYEDVNQNINEEDFRFLIALMQVAKHPKIIHMMIKAYLDLLFDDSDGNRVERIARKLSGLSSTIASVQVTQRSIVFAIQSQIVINILSSSSAKKKVAALNNFSLTLIRMYGYVEEAAFSASELKRLSPEYYSILYHMEIEMLYFIIKPVLSPVVSSVNKRLNDDEIVSILNQLINGV